MSNNEQISEKLARKLLNIVDDEESFSEEDVELYIKIAKEKGLIEKEIEDQYIDLKNEARLSEYSNSYGFKFISLDSYENLSLFVVKLLTMIREK